jgi:hypothetical protein
MKFVEVLLLERKSFAARVASNAVTQEIYRRLA